MRNVILAFAAVICLHALFAVAGAGVGEEGADDAAPVPNQDANLNVGFVDRQGRWKIPPEFSEVSQFVEGLAHVRIGSSHGFVDQSGRRICAFEFDAAKDFSEGLAAVRQNGEWGYIDRNGKLTIEPQFEDAGAFSGGRAAVSRGGSYGYIDAAGNVKIDFQFADATALSEGLAFANLNFRIDEDPIWGVIDMSGSWVVQPTFDEVNGGFAYGLASVSAKGEWFYIDREGKRMFGKTFAHAEPFSEGMAAVQVERGAWLEWEYIDVRGETVLDLPSSARDAEPFSEGLAAVRMNGRYGFIDRAGRFVVKPQFMSMSWLRDGLIRVLPSEGNWAYVDRQGRVVGSDVASRGSVAASPGGEGVGIGSTEQQILGEHGAATSDREFSASVSRGLLIELPRRLRSGTIRRLRYESDGGAWKVFWLAKADDGVWYVFSSNSSPQSP
jgi:hypothetical protein